VLTIERIGDIVRLTMSSWRSRRAGYGVSAYLHRGVLIDTGFPSIGRELERAVDDLRPRAVALTHWHEDHGGNVERLARRRLPIAAAAPTIAALRSLAPIGLYRRVVWGTLQPLRARLEPAHLPGLELVPAPGHSSDHHVVWDPDARVLFAGDLFLGVKVRALHRSEDPRTHAATPRRIAELRPALMLDAHRGIVQEPVSSLLAKADWIDETIHAIESLHVTGRSVRAIAREVLGPADLITVVTLGDLSRENFVRAVLASPASSPVPTA
jgi:endoribonuclease LACTB2